MHHLYIFDLEGTLFRSEFVNDSEPFSWDSWKVLERPFPDTAETLALLRDAGNAICIATNASGVHTRELLASHGVLGLFDAVVGREDVRNGKPDPEMLEMCMGLTGYAPGDTVFIGDSPSDMRAAASAGTRFLLIDREGSTEPPYGERIRTLAEAVGYDFEDPRN
ncbi:MAG: HAD-IA family hydrolase [Candidatus Methanomethylophilaceae archaeon]|nr:HAD-IA family hydrolase [Candidatus Methanomethylophilaceae archaeon]